MKYTKASVNIIYFDMEDIITTSGEENDPGEYNPSAGGDENNPESYYGYLPNGRPCPNANAGKT